MKRIFAILALILTVGVGAGVSNVTAKGFWIRPCSDTSWPPTEPQYTAGYELVHVNWNSEGEFYTYERQCEETYCGSASSGAGCITITKTQTHVYAYYY